MQTAELVSAAIGLPVRAEPRLRERSLGHWEGLTRDEVAEKYPDEFADWIAGRDVSGRGGESREQVAERALAAFAELPDVDTAVLVTHSATAMALTTALLGLDQRVHVLGPLANCHWSELTVRAARRCASRCGGCARTTSARPASSCRCRSSSTPARTRPTPRPRPTLATASTSGQLGHPAAGEQRHSRPSAMSTVSLAPRVAS